MQIKLVKRTSALGHHKPFFTRISISKPTHFHQLFLLVFQRDLRRLFLS
jgi:hypothetical protein